ncbi:MAG: hypothetical protein MUF71_04885 [Candidatus Kapabacteria bacterium]|jgi:hypothetical protein|nr:hypothetical protein [Candidatus Kapabacteria bacterium]
MLQTFVLRHANRLALALVALLSLFTILTLGQRSVAADEFSMYWAAEQSLDTILRLYFSPYENNPAGCAIVQHYWGSVFGYGDESLRLLSLVCIWGALWFLWKLSALYGKPSKQHQILSGEASTFEQDSLQRLTIFAVAATTPVIWMAANFARYQAMVILLGLAALYYYLLWFQSHDEETKEGNAKQGNMRYLLLYAVLTGISFYFHYLSAAVFAVCAGLHYLSTLRRRSMAQILVWGASQLGILLLLVPIIITVLTTYSQMNLGTSPLAATNISKPLAGVLFFGATLVGILNGFAVAPWTVWVVVPIALVALYLLIVGARSPLVARNRTSLFFLALPLVLMSLVVIRMYPPLQFYLIPSVQRVGFLAPLWWIVFGAALTLVPRKGLCWALLGIILVCNVYAIATWNVNIVATQQTPPLRELRDFVRAEAKDISRTTITHPFGYRYGMESVGSTTKGSATAVDRYLPGSTGIFWRETDMTGVVDVDSCKRMVAHSTPEFVIVQRNRLHINADNLAQALTESGYALKAEQQLQRQSAVDVWFKAQMLKLPIGGFKEDAVPQPYIYTVRYYRKE